MSFAEPIGRFYVALGMDTSEFRKEIDRSQRVMKKALGQEAIELSENLATAVAAIGAAFAGVAVASVKMAADMEQVEVAFTTLLRSGTAARQVLADIEAFAAVTPFRFDELAQAARTLLAFGGSTRELIPVLTRLGDVAAGINMPIAELARLYGRARVQGRLMMEDINALTGRGIPIIQSLAAQFGVVEMEVRNLVSSGQVQFKHLEQAFIDLTTGAGLFAGGMKAQSQTIHGIMSTLADSVVVLMREAGRNITEALDLHEVLAGLARHMEALVTRVRGAGLAETFVAELGRGRYVVIGLAGAIAGALIPALQSMTAWAAKSLVPLLPLIATFGKFTAAFAAIAAGAAYLYDQRVFVTRFFESVKLSAQAALHDVAARLSGMLAEMLDIVRAAIQDTQLAEHFAEPLARAQVAFSRLGHEAQRFAEAARAARVDLLDRSFDGLAVSIVALVRASGQLPAFFANLVSHIDRVLPGTAALAQHLTRIAGQLMQAPAVPAAPGAGVATPHQAPVVNRAAEDAKRISDSIRRTWIQATHSKREQLDVWYQEEIAALERVRHASTTHLQDRERLEQTYLARLNEMNSAAEQERKRAEQAAANEAAKVAAQRAEQAGAALGRQMAQEAADAEALADRLEAIRTGQMLETQLREDYQAADLASYMAHLSQKNAAFLAHLQGQRQVMDTYRMFAQEAQRASVSYMAEGYRTLYGGMTDALTGIIMGTQSAADALKNLGLQLISMVVRWMVQRKLAAAMSRSLEAATTASSMAAGTAVAAAWAPAAALVAAATFGAATAAGAAGLVGIGTLARTLAIPGLAEGGVVTRPTLAMIGEGGGPEAVVPLDQLGRLGGEPKVTLNVHNNTGTPMQPRQQVSRSGQEVVVDLFLDAWARDVNGLRSVVGGSV